jgi:hypothetical protein
MKELNHYRDILMKTVEWINIDTVYFKQ